MKKKKYIEVVDSISGARVFATTRETADKIEAYLEAYYKNNELGKVKTKNH